MSWTAVERQPRATSILKSALEKGRLPHALLFTGPADSGQKETALELAKAILCEARKGAEPCEACAHCRKVSKNAHPDLFWLAPEEDSRTIKIEAVRDLKSRTVLKPFEAAAKVFVIESADCMNEAAQNALLKTLEEPEGASFFILISPSMEKLLVTIRSRTQAVPFLPARQETVADPEVLAWRRQATEHLRDLDAGRRGPAPDFSKLERGEIAGLFDYLIEYFRENLLASVEAGDSAAAELLCGRIELLAEFKEKILANVNSKLALNVLWDEWTT